MRTAGAVHGGSAIKTLIAVVVAAAVGALHFAENCAYLRHVQRIPDKGLRQVATLHTENAFYYAYYAELVEADGLATGLAGILRDRRSEYPDDINALRRFNIYQEVVVGLEYRALRACGLDYLDAWDFFRYHVLALNAVGHAAVALLSSEVSGNPFAGVACFIVSFLNRFQISRLGNHASANLRELWGIPVLWVQVLYLWHILLAPEGTARRHVWCGFGLSTFLFILLWQFSPFLLLLQMTAIYFVYLVCGYRGMGPTVRRIIHVYLAAVALAVAAQLGSPYLLTSPFLVQLVALKVSTATCGCSRRGAGGRHQARLSGWVASFAEGFLALAVFVLIRRALAPFATADTHVYEILCTKVTEVNNLLPETIQLPRGRLPECAEPSFNARLYLIMGVFKLLERSSLQVYYDTSAGPAAALACALVFLRYLSACAQGCLASGSRGAPAGLEQPLRKGPAESTPGAASGAGQMGPERSSDGTGLRRRGAGRGGHPGGEAATNGGRQADPRGPAGAHSDRVKCEGDGAVTHEGREDAALLFFVVQFLLFLALGALINRMRVAFGPPMMVLAASCFGPRLFPARRLLRQQPLALLGVAGVCFCAHLLWMVLQLPCISQTEGICQHFSDKSTHDGDLADLFDWINRHLDPRTPTLASMNLAGSLRLFTGVPLVIHPQFETEHLRRRVQLAYELYHCGSEESFVRTMRQLHAEVVIFEYARCFFTPYTLDDRRKNCNSKKHEPEDLLCIKLHARSRYFQLIFTNGGYAVFRLRPVALPPRDGGTEASPAATKGVLARPDTWRDYIYECARTQSPLCGARLLETAAAWDHGLHRKKVASLLRKLADEQFPEDGYVAFYLARHLDYEAGEPVSARRYYEKAIKKLPNNAKVLLEYIMYLEMALHDSAAVSKLLRSRHKRQSGGPTPLLSMEGPSVGHLLCEAAVSAKNTPGLEKLGGDMWSKALRLAPLSECLKVNWPLIYGNDAPDSYNRTHRNWDMVWMLVAGGVQHDITSNHQPPIRFPGDRPFLLRPHGRHA